MIESVAYKAAQNLIRATATQSDHRHVFQSSSEYCIHFQLGHGKQIHDALLLLLCYT